MKPAAALLAVCLALVLAACGTGPSPQPAGQAAEPGPTPEPVEITVSAAASLTDALHTIQTEFEVAHQSIRVRFNFGSSGALQQQIAQGAPVDLFIAAGPEPMKALIEAGLVEASAVRNLASNQVVLIRGQSAADTVKGWEDLASPHVRRIALGNPAHVPAGQYAQAVLEHLGLWDAVQPRLVFGEDVRQVLNFVASGEADAGIVYRTDAAGSPEVIVLAEAPEGSHPPVLYPMAVLEESPRKAQALAFADYLLSPAGVEILRQHGFGPVN